MTSSSFIGLPTMAIDPHPIKVQDSLLPIEPKLVDKRKMVEETNNSKRIKKSTFSLPSNISYSQLSLNSTNTSSSQSINSLCGSDTPNEEPLDLSVKPLCL